MKAFQYLIIAILILSNPLFSQSNYEPLIDTTKQWNIIEYVWDYENGDPQKGYLTYMRTLSERFRGTADIDGKKYYYLEQCKYDSLFQNWNQTNYLYREDTIEKQVFVYLSDQEYILYDFSLDVGDTLSIHLDFVVDSIKIENIANKDRKVIYFNSSGCGNHKMVEGIGSFEEMIAPYWWCSVGGNKGYELQCLYKDSDLIYQKDNSCFTYADFTDIQKVETDLDISVYPNPASNKISIVSSQILKDASLIIFSVDGKVSITKPMERKQVTLSTQQLVNGVYFLTISQNKKYIFKKKIIIYH